MVAPGTGHTLRALANKSMYHSGRLDLSNPAQVLVRINPLSLHTNYCTAHVGMTSDLYSVIVNLSPLQDDE